MKTEETAFIHAIQDDPNDNNLRLIYADWLEERGDIRGEYLRLECQLSISARLENLRESIDPSWLAAVSPSLANETPIKDGAANLQRGIETVGGWLYLTNQRLVFESHAFNVQTGATVIPLASITGTRLSWTQFLNRIPVFPNSMAVATTEGREYRFVLFGRQQWLDAIEEQRT
jgi:uncharacterized protein (TIGR02996 family)